MNAAALVLASLLAAPQGAALHPADAVLYLEVPDVARLVEAYPRAPFLAMLADETVRETLTGFGIDGAELDAVGQPARLLERLTSEVDPAVVVGIRRLSLSMRSDDGGGLGVEVVLDYADAEGANRALDALRAHTGPPAAEEETAVPPPGAPHRFTLDELGGMPAWSLTRDASLFLGLGTAAPEAALARRDDASGGLAADETYRSMAGTLGEAKGAVVLQGFSRRSPFELLARAMRDGAAAGPLSAVDALGGVQRWRMQLVGDRFVSESFRREAADTERVLGVGPYPKDWLALVPHDAMLVYTTTLDPARLAAGLERWLGTRAEGHEEAVGELAAAVGKLGSSVVAYAQPLSGLGLPPAFGWIELRDAEGFQAQVAAALTRLGTEVEGFGANTRDYRVKDERTGERVKVPVTTLDLPLEGLEGMPVAINPSFAIHEGKLLVAFSPMHVKRELKRLYGAPEASAGVNPIRALEERTGVSIPDDAASAILMDWGSLVEGLVSLVRNLGGMIAAMAGDEGELPFDPASLPEAKTFTRFFTPTLHYSRHVEGGLYRHHEASFGPETWIGLGTLAYLAMDAMEGGAGR